MKANQREAVRKILAAELPKHHQSIFSNDLLFIFDIDLESCIADMNDIERAELAKSGHLKVINLLYNDESWWVRTCVANHANTTIMKKMVNDSSPTVLETLKKRGNPEVLALLESTN